MAAEDVFGIVGTTQAGNFHVERVVAEGGFGVVYRAHHGGFRAPVAIKCLKIPEQMTKQQRDVFLEKFREEAELMFRLSAAITEVCRPLHVDVLLLGDGRFVPFLAMEWLDGESLDGIITRRREQGQTPLGLQKVVKMLRSVAAALSRAHRFPGPQGAVSIIHRDLKPENLFLATIGGTETMKILDFGIAKAKRSATQAAGRVTGRSLAEDEMASFTPAYGAPEQWTPKVFGETGPWTDVWGLALTMVEALCGAPPIDGEQYMMRRACLDEKRRPTPRAYGADVPIEVEKVFERALAVDPRKRFPSVEAFWSELEKAMGLPPSLGRRDDRLEPGEQRGEEEANLDGGSGPKVLSAAAMTTTATGLARINLQKAKPPVVRAGSAPAIAPPPPRAPEASNWEFDLGAPSSQRPGTPSSQRPGAPSSQRPGVPPDLEMNLPSASQPPPAAAIRRSAMDLEMFLPSRSDPPPASSSRPASLEMSLPTGSDRPGPPSTRSPEPLSSKRPPARSAPGLDMGGPFDEPAVEFGLHLPAAPSIPLATIEAPPPPPAGGFDLAPGSARPFDAGAGVRRRRHAAEGHEVRERLRAPLGILLLALSVATMEIGFHKITGGDLMFGPVRPFWIAAPLALLGVGFTLWRLMEDRDDD